ncbi:fatty acid desaturase family protein [Pseudonocardia sp. GCM10023141]|uniref:fatty acid desaturase family protein n=1 Tax=Pseudonocardia sp. GCM10023141 TaxID=3252653 RepID=UPI0036154330
MTRNGDVTGAAVPETRRGSEFAELSREVKAAGLMARRTRGYWVRIGVTLGIYAAAWTAFGLLGPSWWQLAVAAVLAIVFTQIGFLGHDAGHRQVFHTRRANDLLGLVCANLLIGLSYSWWIDKHNRHHANPNHVDRDPDIAVSVVAFTPAQAQDRGGAFGRAVARHQAALFFPLLLLEAIALHVASVRALVTRPTDRPRVIESVLLGIHGVAYVAAIVIVLPPWQAVAFVAVHQGLFGLYLGSTFAPNHKGMAVLSDSDELDYLRRQVLTSRNIAGSRFLDMAMGGLNHQIEHHLFPSMPSMSLRRAKPPVRAFCMEHDVAYVETTLTGSYAHVLRYLDDVGVLATPPVKGAVSGP